MRPIAFAAWVILLLATSLPAAAPAGAAKSATPSVRLERLAESVAGIQPAAMRRALEDMASTWPERCPLGKQQSLLDDPDTRIESLLKRLRAGEEAAVPESEKLLADVRAALLANPLLDFDRLLVLRRQFPDVNAARSAAPGTTNNWLTCDAIPRQNAWRDALVVLSQLRGPVAEQMLYQPETMETILDPDLHFDGERILFAKNGVQQKNYRLWEIGVNGQALRQVTADDGNDVGHFDGCYLPNGDIMFASTAAYQGLPCTYGSSMVCLYRLHRDTGAVRQLTFEQDSDWCPTVLPSGRVMYLRWEYTDQSHANSRILFHMNPDGTDQRELRGSGSWFPGSFFFARPVPGPARLVIGVAGGHHDQPRAGRLLLLDTAKGRREAEGVTQEIPGYGKPVEPLVRDGLIGGHYPQFLMPYPLSEKYHLVAMKRSATALWGLYLVDVFDNLTLIKEGEGTAYLEPIPLRRVERPPTVQDRVDVNSDTATVHVHDISAGPGLAGVPRGTVKQLRIIHYNFARRGMGGLYGLLGMDGPWDVKRILGTVPVTEDGSAYFTIPANIPISLQPLDERGQALQLMRSWLVGMPGEKLSCVGCHESQDATPKPVKPLSRRPDPITPWFGPARGFSFVREVQPVLDRYCINCHDGEHAPPDLRGGNMLAGWTTEMAGRCGHGGKFSASYAELHRYLRRPGIEGDRRMFSPLDYHFRQTELGQMLRKGHYAVQLDAESFERLAAWHDFNAPFYGTWGEIKEIGCARMATLDQRALELRRRYVPMGPFIDTEAIPQTPKYDTTPVAPQPVADVSPQDTACPGWPFTADAAVRRQQETAPPRTNGRRLLPLVEPEKPTEEVRARHVRVCAGPARWLSIAEAEVFSAGQNVARGQPTRQSSTAYGGEASRAVDGIKDGNWGAGSITHTGNGDHEWWEVELPRSCVIDKLVFWNRADCAQERLAGCAVQLLDDQHKLVWEKTTPSTVGASTALGVSQSANELGVALVWIPPGEFLMGSRDGHRDERPLHRVRIERGFWMSQFEVTNDLFLQFDPLHESRTEDRHGYQFGITGYDQDQPRQPAVRVSWREATAFCRWLSAKTGRRFSLPTEAQWEWACRAGTATPFWYGDQDTDFSKKANLGDFMLAYFSGNPYVQDFRAAWSKNPENRFDNWIPQDSRFNDDGFVTEPVGRYAANPWGLCDMHGNAWEWTRSQYRPYPYQEQDGRNAAATSPSDERVVRGGSWYDRPFKCTSSYRQPYPSWQKVYNVGFRVVCVDDTQPLVRVGLRTPLTPRLGATGATGSASARRPRGA
jgi:formylglycine-generating enzyme required for sulfatase activity